MPSAGFKLAITAYERPQTHALDRTVTGLGTILYQLGDWMLVLVFIVSEISVLCSVEFLYVW
jgi:hypothetical protein